MFDERRAISLNQNIVHRYCILIANSMPNHSGARHNFSPKYDNIGLKQVGAEMAKVDFFFPFLLL